MEQKYIAEFIRIKIQEADHLNNMLRLSRFLPTEIDINGVCYTKKKEVQESSDRSHDSFADINTDF
jgi:hypothetical protein